MFCPLHSLTAYVTKNQTIIQKPKLLGPRFIFSRMDRCYVKTALHELYCAAQPIINKTSSVKPDGRIMRDYRRNNRQSRSG